MKVTKIEDVIETIDARLFTLKKAISSAEKDEGNYPEGRLRVSESNNRYRYYRVTKKNDRDGKYIKRENAKMAEKLAKKDYNRIFLKQARYEVKKLEQLKEKLSNENGDMAYRGLSEARQILVVPYISTDEDFVKNWQEKPIKVNEYMEENKVYDTKRGEKVRSKSEAILADILYELSIPYHYEKALKMKDGTYKYPDFTLLNVKKREEIYLEHFGLLDDDEYRINSLIKMDEYRDNNIYPGKNLLFTYETEENPLDIKGIRKMLKEIMM